MYEMLSGGFLIFTDQANLSGWTAWSTYDNGALYFKMKERIMKIGAEPDWAVLAPYVRRPQHAPLLMNAGFVEICPLPSPSKLVGRGRGGNPLQLGGRG